MAGAARCFPGGRFQGTQPTFSAPQLSLLFLALPTPALPQDTVLPEAIVSAPRSGQPASESAGTVTVVSGEDLRKTGERSLPRCLDRAAEEVISGWRFRPATCRGIAVGGTVLQSVVFILD